MKNNKIFFPIFANSPGLVYLDSAASAQKPASVTGGMKHMMENAYANIHRGIYKLSIEASALYDDARKKVAGFIGADAGEVVFTRGTTEAINLAAYSFAGKFGAGDKVIVGGAEHHSNILPWLRLRERGVEVEFIPVLPDGALDLEWLEKNISESVRLVAVSGQSNVIGLVNDAALVCAIAHEHGAKVIVDAAQMAAHAKIDVRGMGADFLAFSAHKIYGPTGIGVLWGRRELLESMEPYQLGGDMVESVALDNIVYRDPPGKFEAGTALIVEAHGLGLAIDFLSGLGMERVERESLELTLMAREKLSGIDGIRFLSHPQANGLVSFAIDGVSPFDIATLLAEAGVCVRAGMHCAEPLHASLGFGGSVRASFGVYNDEDDIGALAAGLKKAMEILR